MTTVKIVTEVSERDGASMGDISVYVDGKIVAGGRAGGGEPEDNTYHRDYDWIDDALVKLAKACGAEVTHDVTEVR